MSRPIYLSARQFPQIRDEGGVCPASDGPGQQDGKLRHRRLQAASHAAAAAKRGSSVTAPCEFGSVRRK